MECAGSHMLGQNLFCHFLRPFVSALSIIAMSPPSDIHRGVDKQKNWLKGETTLIKVFIFFRIFQKSHQNKKRAR